MIEYTARITSTQHEDVDTIRKHIDNAFAHIEDITRELDGTRRYYISPSGYVTSTAVRSCRAVSREVPPTIRLCTPPTTQSPVQLTLRSDYDTLKAQVATLTSELNKLKAETRITPVANTYLRKQGSTLYPKYGDWILTSDASDQYISFSGLTAEIGRSIYIQTRRKAYLYANNHSFFGLPSSSTSVSQWLSNNTTYRFVRASSTSWFVTSSPSPYPWT